MFGMLELMMDSLLSKEILYEPLKELGDKVCPPSSIPPPPPCNKALTFFSLSLHLAQNQTKPNQKQYPAYLQTHTTTLSAADKSRYEAQLGYITQKIRKDIRGPGV